MFISLFFYLALIFTNYYADENLCNTIIQNLIDYLYHIFLIHIGITVLKLKMILKNKEDI